MRVFWLSFCLLCSIYLCSAQTPGADQHGLDLRFTLDSLTRQYSIRFSYIDEVVADKRVQLAPTSSLDQMLHSLQDETGLRFEQVTDQYVLIRPYATTDTVDICGRLTDQKNIPIEGAVILTTNPDQGAISNEQGEFHLTSVPYTTTLTVTHLGFTPKSVEASHLLNADCGQVVLHEGVEILSALVFTDYLTIGLTKDRKDLTLSPQQLKILPGLIEPDLLRSIQLSPGINSPYETASGIHVRGGSPDQNLVLWNGIKSYSQGHFFGMLSTFNPYVTEDVRFIKNGTSARYGSRVSSVIDIKTPQEIPEKVSGGAGFNLLYGDAYLNSPLVKDRLSCMFSARRSYTDVFRTITYKKFSDRVFQNTKINNQVTSNPQLAQNEFYFNDFTGNMIWQATKENKVILNALYNKNDLDFSSSNEAGDRSFHDLLKTENEGYNFQWLSTPGDRLKFSTDFYFTQYLLRYEFRTRENDTTEIASKKNLVLDLGASFQADWQISPVHRFSGGYEFISNRIQYAYESFTPAYEIVLDYENNHLNTHALFFEHQIDRNRTFLSTGFRVNHYDRLSRTYFEPRIFIQQQLSDLFRISASGEYKTQTASQIKESVVSDLSLENQVWTLASKEKFPVIEGYQLTFGGDFKYRGWLIDWEGYHKVIDGVTTLTFGFLNPIDNEFRQGKSRIYGSDFFVKRVFGSYKTWLAYSYIHTQNQFTGLNDNKPFPGNWNIEHTVKWSHFYQTGPLELSVGWVWHTGKAFTEVIEQSSGPGPVNVEFSAINGKTLPVYHRLDFSALYELRADKRIRYKFGLSIQNVYNRKNILNQEIRTTPSLNNELINTRVYSLGFTPNIVCRIFF